MKFKKIITLLLVLSLMLTLLSSCAETGDGLQAETTENDTKTLETTGSNSNDTEKPEDTTGGTPETTIPEGVDIELYNAAKKALIQLDDETKKEIEKALNLIPISGDWWININGSSREWYCKLSCYGEFEKCIVVFSPGIAAVHTTKTIADSDFSFNSAFGIFGYCNGILYDLQEAYTSGYISKEEVAIAAERHETIRRYVRSRK